MGLFVTGVTVVAVDVPEGVHGMTANAVASVSLDPMLVLVCVDKRARMHGQLAVRRTFSINILREDQEPLSRYFAGRGPQTAPPEFRFRRWEHGPLLVGALATVGCQMEQLLEGGDHTLVLGRVTGLQQGETGRPPLLCGARPPPRGGGGEPAAPPADEWPPEPVPIYYDKP